MENQAIKEKESKHCNRGTGSYKMSKTPVKKESDVNRQILVDALKRAYHRKHTRIKPVPFEAVSLCVSDVYIEGAIEVLDRRKGEKDPCRWTAIQSRHDLFKPLKDLDGTRILIDGEPGYGKSTLLRQYAHDFFNQSPESPVNRFSIFVLLPLRELCNVNCIYQAIRSQLPDNTLTAEAITDVIKDNVSALLIGFDGFDKYSDRGSPQSFVAQIMNNKLLEQCTAICSTRMGCSLPLPSPTMKHFRLSGFNNNMQKAYIKNAFRSTENAGILKDRILRQLQQNPAFDAIFKVPLFFVVFAHIRGNEEITENLDTVTGFFAHMMKTLLDHQRNKDTPDQHIDSLLEPLLQKLAELAFNGLCSQNQKFFWEAPEVNKLIDKATLEMLTFSGILVQEEKPYIAKTPGANESFWKTSKTHFKFFHKIFQEYFAALHISGLAKQKYTEHLAKEALVNLNHIELQYVYRFACGMNKATAKIILDLFTKNSKGSLLFATLCLLETDSEDKYNEVRKHCCSGLVVNHYDSKSLQTSTIQLLQIASQQLIPLPSLELSCCVKSVNLEQETLHLFSGLVISKLETVEELTLTFTNCVNMAASLLGLFSRIQVLKAVRFKHSKLPRSFDDRCVLRDLESNQCKVSWKNVSLEVKLNLSTGRWENANGDEMTDEDYERMLCEPFSLNFEELKRKLAEILPQNSCAEIASHFSLQEDQVAEISGNKSDLLDVLEERGYIHAANIRRLVKSLRELEMTDSVLEIAESYQNSIGTETSYDQFLASLSYHLTLSYPEKLCDHFEFSVVEKKEIVESDTPGIALLLTLNKRGSINSTTVGKLVEPLTKYKLVQAVAKVKEYQSMVDRSGEKKTTVPTLKDKQDMLSTCIKRKIRNLLEVTTPTPWKKSCQWKNQELFIPWELILTRSKSKPDISKNDFHSNLRYEDIFTDSKLKNMTRIILEGEQGSGKTMLSYQFTFLGMTEEIEGAPMVIYLPLKFVEDMTIEEAITRFYIQKDIPINEQDIKAMLNSGMNTKYLVLDGLDEYNCTTQSSEVMKIMRKEKYPSCKVILTSSSNMTYDLPQCPMLKLMMFDEVKRQLYIENIIPGDKQKQLEFTKAVKDSSVLRDLCSTPLVFAFIVHNMVSLKLDQIHMKSVGSIIEEMINIIFSQTGSECKESNMMKVEEHSERLSEIAFNGLCRGYQQLQWPKTFFDKSIPNVKQWLNSGLLILEEPLREGKGQQTIERDATGSDAMRSKETFEQSYKVEQVIENETTTKRGKKRRIHAPFEESLCRVGVQHVKRGPPEELPKATCSSPFGISSYPKRSMITADQLYPGKVYSQVKFIHKIIQEWFAAKHLFILLSQAMKRDTIDSVLTKHIPLIKPADLYIIRFTSYLCPRSCPAIVKSLMDRHRSPDGVVPENILNIAFLCFAELVEQTDNAHTMDTVKLLITEPVIIRGEDNKLLQQSKISVLTYALNKKIEVGCLKLINIVVNVNWNRLVFNSGLAIELLHTLNILEIYRWDQKLSEREENLDYQNLIAYISNLASLKKAYLDFPDAPPAIPVFTQASIKSRMIEIKWAIGSFLHTLDWETAEWRADDGVQDHNTVKDYGPDPREHDGSTRTGNQMDRAVQTENEQISPTLDDFIEEISGKITWEWRDIGRKLGLSDQILKDLYTNFEYTKDRVREMFLIWTRTEGNEATFHSLKTALLYAGRKDLADKITCTFIMEKYAIVEFQNSLAGVVPTSWIFKKDGKIWCKWTASRTKAIACELPNPSWTTSSIKRVVAYRASYSEADNVCLGFEHSSTVEVTEADLNFPDADPATSSSTSNSKRNIFRPLHYTGEPNSNTDETGKNSKNQRQKRGKKRSLHTLDEAELDEASTAEEPSSESDETGENSKKGTKKRFLHDAELDEASHTKEELSSESDGPAKQQSELPPPPETSHTRVLSPVSGRFEDLVTPGVSPVAHIRHQETVTPGRISNRPTPVKNEDLYDLLSRLLQVGEENRRLNIENKHDIDRLKLEILQAAPGEAEEVVECFNKKLSTVLELNQFEQKLKDQPFRQKVTSYLTTYSGADPGKMVLAMMTAVTENSLAEQYSYAGKSKNGVAKLPFKGLYLNKCIYYAVKRRFQSTQDLRVLVKNGVESWLRSSPMRSKREQQHKSTLESDSDSDAY